MSSEASDEDLWGPELDQYSRDFEPFISEISWETFTDFSGSHEVLTLDGLETTLGLSDPRRSDFHQAELSISDAMKMLLLYTMDGQPIFKHYWGFLCVRYILHATCLTLLEEVGMLDGVLKLLPPSVNWNEFSEAIAYAASGIAADTVTTPVLPRILNQIFSETRFSKFEGTIESDAGYLIRELWLDRESFFTLCSNGLLPGCALLFLAAWKWLPTEPRDRFRGYCSFLQDLCYRLYLVGSNEDLQVVHRVCMYMIDKDMEWDRFRERFVSSEDSRELTWAYGELLSAARSDQSIVEVLSVEIMGLVGKFVLEMLMVDDTATLQEILVVNHQNFEFLWLFLEHRGRVSLVDGDKIKSITSTTFMFTANTQTHLVKTREDQLDFARMLAASEIVSLMARMLLTVMDKGKAFPCNFIHVYLLIDIPCLGYVFRGMEEWGPLLGSVFRLGEALDKSISHAPELFHDSKIEWAKFLGHLGLDVRLGVRDDTGKAKFLREMALNMTNWAKNRGFLGADNSAPQRCGHNRCVQPIGQERTLGVSFMCGKCKAIRYCSPDCQQA
ncbi:hypothetical protein FRC10_010765 [Ceratobasidium sp. 414]|nr:hypothetical protein FRC10_010765 [Ceratobasidium sp. 414]